MNYKSFSVLTLICAFLLTLSSCNSDDCKPASTANAGPDQVASGTSTTLEAATLPKSGSGIWTITSGDGGSITTPTSPTSVFTGSAGATYVLKWTVNGCPISEDEVQITFCSPASTAIAGPDQNITATSTTLAATPPTSGSGTWSIVSGTGGNIVSVTNPASEFTGAVGTYVLKWTVSGCPSSEDDVQIIFNNNPKLLTVDKTTVINGEIITVTGLNFSSNFQGMSQIKAVNQADITKEVFLPIISRTATEIKAVMQGTNGGSTGTYKLFYGKRADAGAAVFFESTLIVTINAATANQFFSSSTYTQTNVSPGGSVSLGTKNGSATAADYTVKVIGYAYETGVGTEYTVSNAAITVGGYGGSMDQLSFTLPANLPVGTYYTKITYNNATVIGGWGNSLNVF
jgi:hypothetical protein